MHKLDVHRLCILCIILIVLLLAVVPKRCVLQRGGVFCNPKSATCSVLTLLLLLLLLVVSCHPAGRWRVLQPQVSDMDLTCRMLLLLLLLVFVCRVAACSATPSQRQRLPSCGCCTSARQWHWS
jgi:hypothetical protein